MSHLTEGSALLGSASETVLAHLGDKNHAVCSLVDIKTSMANDSILG